MFGPAGAVALHGALRFLLFHFQTMRVLFGQSAAGEDNGHGLAPDPAKIPVRFELEAPRP